MCIQINITGFAMNHSERAAWIQLALTPYIGAESFLALIKHYGSAQAALSAPAESIRHLVYHKQAVAAWKEKSGLAVAAAQAALTWEQQENCRLMLLCDNDFPVMLAEGITPPPLLFLRGRVELLHRPSVAIVGSRHATPQAMRIARDFAHALSERGISVVSGMASGIDTAAHQGALLSKGSTVAVWGNGYRQDLSSSQSKPGLSNCRERADCKRVSAQHPPAGRQFPTQKPPDCGFIQSCIGCRSRT